MDLKYANKLNDEELKEIYQLFLCKDERLVCLDISRYDDEIFLEGKIELPEFEEEHLNDYALSDYDVNIFHHSGDLTPVYRKYMLEKFGTDYAVDYLINY